MIVKSVISNYIRIPDTDVFPDYYPYKPVGNIDFIEENPQQSATRLSKYLTFLGLKFKLLTFLNEAKEFEKVLYEYLLTGKIDLQDNQNIGYNYMYGYVNEEAITKFIIILNTESSEAFTIKLTKIAIIINAIYYEYTIRKFGGDAYPNKLLTIKIRNMTGNIEKLETEIFELSYKIGLKTGRLTANKELNDRVHNYNYLPSHVKFINKTYHADFLIQLT